MDRGCTVQLTVVERYTVDHVKRLVVAGDGVDTTQSDAGRAAQVAAARDDLQAGNLAGEGAHGVGGTCFEGIGGDFLYCVTECLLLAGNI